MYTLRKYQQDAVDATIKHFQQSKRPAVIVLPTGAGKSLVIAKLAALAKGRVLVLTHVKELVEQNYHKYLSYAENATLYSAGLKQKDYKNKVVFASVQSFINAEDAAYHHYTLVIIDECHRINLAKETQYQVIFDKISKHNPNICLLGLTATPYRLDLGWIYNFHYLHGLRNESDRFFKKCIYEKSLESMINENFLVPPIKIDSPVTGYDFSQLRKKNERFQLSDIEKELTKQKRLTPLIVKNIIDFTQRYQRQGVMLFTSSIRHANEVFNELPTHEAGLITGKTPSEQRDQIIKDFKQQKIKYLVNVSVLTTGFDAPHVDLMAILRPTESVSLYQQIIGRGLRLHPNKEDCLILDYTGQEHDLYSPLIKDKKPHDLAQLVKINCPLCQFENQFWGIKNAQGEVEEHFGRSCQAIAENDLGELKKCPYLFRYKLCPQCNHQNDISARICTHCDTPLIDAEAKIKQAMSLKDAHVLKVEEIEYYETLDKKNRPCFEIKYYDVDAQSLSEKYIFDTQQQSKQFIYNFLRLHLKRPEKHSSKMTAQQAYQLKHLYRSPQYVIARKKNKSWKITEKIFITDLIP